jgi:hypothetical protein
MPSHAQSSVTTPLSELAAPSIAVLVASCDKYADLWPLFFELFRKFWPDCLFRVYLLTNHLRPSFSGVVSVPVGDDASWSGNLRKALHSIPENHVLLLVEDLFVLGRVNNRTVVKLAAEFISASGNCLKMNPTVPGNVRLNDRLDLSLPGAPYRLSAVLTLWKKSVLHDLLVEDETAWDFEIEGSRRSDVYDNFFVSRKNQFEMVNGVIKGHWSRRALAQVQAALGRPIAPARPVLSFPRELLYQMALQRSRLLYRLPPGWGRGMLDALRCLRDRHKRKVSAPGR